MMQKNGRAMSVCLLLVATFLRMTAFSEPLKNAGSSADRIAGSVQPFVDSGTLAGAVLLVASKDKVLSLNAVGYGAYATDMSIDPQRQVITIYMVQHAGYPGTEGKNIHPAFRKVANEIFGQSRE